MIRILPGICNELVMKKAPAKTGAFELLFLDLVRLDQRGAGQ